jgi:hypothetical protein
VDIGRRDLIRLTAAAALKNSLAATPAKPRFFTPEEFAAVDELTEMIIPADEHSPGAKAAKVAEYLDGYLAEAFDEEERTHFREGLRPYVSASSAQRLTMLTKSAQNEAKPATAEERFFRLIKEHTIRGYYTSKIGIHDDLAYRGNTYQTGEYAGYLPAPERK